LDVRNADGILTLVPDTNPPPLAPAVATTVTCPSCGVAVAVGYPKCPRCHSAVPQAPRTKRQTLREEMLAGGTSVEPPEMPATSSPLLPLAIGVVALGAVVAGFVLLRKEPTTKPAIEPAGEVEGDDTEAQDDEPGAPDEPGAAIEAGAAPVADVQLDDAVDSLSEELRVQRLWATVRADGSVIEIQSSLCDDKAMTAAVDGAGLAGTGATAVRCVAAHGGVVWERGL
jgi:hypothetical protein